MKVKGQLMAGDRAMEGVAALVNQEVMGLMKMEGPQEDDRLQ